MDHYGIVPASSTLYVPFTTHDTDGAAVAPNSAFEAADVRVYKNGSATQRNTESGYTMTSPFDSVTGLHMLAIDLSDNTDAGFYAAGSRYSVVLVPDETVDGFAVVRVLADFTIGPPAVNVSEFGGTAGTFSGGRPEVNTSHAAGTAWGSGAITAASIASDAITAAKIATGAIDADAIADGAIDAGAIASDAITSAKIADNAITAAKLAADAITAAKIADGAIDAATFAAGAITAAAIASDAITDAKVASDVTIASVTGAVGSVTGNVGGNVTGSVGSVVGAVGSVTGNVGGNVTGTVGGFTTTAKAEIQTEAEDALVTHRLDELLNADSDIDGAAPPTVGSVVHELMSKTAGSFTYDQTTDSLEAVRDRGDAAWTTATGFSTLDAAGVRTAVGLASANLDTQLTAIDDYLDTEVAAIKAKTDNLPSDPADASDIAASFATVNTKLDTIDDFLDTEVAAIKAKTDNLPSDPADASDIASSFSTVNTTLATIAAYIDTEIAAIKTVTDQLTAAQSEPSAVPAANASPLAKLAWLAALARNKVTQSATTQTLRNDADSADIATATVSDSGTVFTRGEWT